MTVSVIDYILVDLLTTKTGNAINRLSAWYFNSIIKKGEFLYGCDNKTYVYGGNVSFNNSLPGI